MEKNIKRYPRIYFVSEKSGIVCRKDSRFIVSCETGNPIMGYKYDPASICLRVGEVEYKKALKFSYGKWYDYYRELDHMQESTRKQKEMYRLWKMKNMIKNRRNSDGDEEGSSYDGL